MLFRRTDILLTEDRKLYTVEDKILVVVLYVDFSKNCNCPFIIICD